ncbi:hypothetical protein DPMN_184138 [Dreissena polymorpha]|uniref:Uncharacterized protein n=2 Tax=Dreissena polymorpha TaxID=45954 RepID=A0A9D4I7L4_DREPO|nr:hypothetical protein DPMN_184138 [Dreissena polymorpha]
MKERLKDVDIQAITARKLALQVVGTHWSPSDQALLNRTLFGAACQPNKRQIENYLYQQRKKIHKTVSLVPYADSDNDDGDDSDNDDGDGTAYGLV